jgi:hypothetical protein
LAAKTALLKIVEIAIGAASAEASRTLAAESRAPQIFKSTLWTLHSRIPGRSERLCPALIDHPAASFYDSGHDVQCSSHDLRNWETKIVQGQVKEQNSPLL